MYINLPYFGTFNTRYALILTPTSSASFLTHLQGGDASNKGKKLHNDKYDEAVDVSQSVDQASPKPDAKFDRRNMEFD